MHAFIDQIRNWLLVFTSNWRNQSISILCFSRSEDRDCAISRGREQEEEEEGRWFSCWKLKPSSMSKAEPIKQSCVPQMAYGPKPILVSKHRFSARTAMIVLQKGKKKSRKRRTKRKKLFLEREREREFWRYIWVLKMIHTHGNKKG